MATSSATPQAPTSQSVPVYPVDAISALGIHNGVVRIQFMRLSTEGNAIPTVELFLPISQMKSLADTLIRSAK
jgi:hypothetical protein